MKLHLAWLSAVILAFCGACGAAAADHDDAEGSGPRAQETSLPEGGAVFVDLLAADFFESDLRLAQSRRIEAQTARRYLSLDAEERARFRAARRQAWREMSEAERLALRGAKRPRFANLDEAQKQTFRRIAAQELGAASGSERQYARGDI